MAVKSPYNSWAKKRPVSYDSARAARTAEVVNIQQWAKGKAELEAK
ncbi:hypothetical protein WOSG25_060630 [Weissella oryzae SG25]|uniref:Uncharacterized protein n=1 Tax=Weissella oryzae (strain DSM 25784 / JCM 18191 / LMG 30913 / SG25) TaxID=1329250 RepID=A0A069CUP2_WEIOS|nr:hypothetical protein [Weissella oryzae]GAK30943.1 hypothetical protein WOSG25_060630 [Weissella oryzae SG25]